MSNNVDFLNDFYPSLDKIEGRIKALEEEKKVLNWQLNELKEELRKVDQELQMLYVLKQFIISGKIYDEDLEKLKKEVDNNDNNSRS